MRMGIKKLFKNIFGGGKKKMAKKVKNKKLKAKSAGKKAKAKKIVKKTKKAVKKAAPKKKIVQKAVKKTAVKVVKAQKAVKVVAAKPVEVKPAVVVKKAPVKVKKGPHMAYIGIGSNVGDREEYIEQAIFLLTKTPGVKVIKKSTNYETDAEGPGDQPSYLNAAVQISTVLDPYKLLESLHETENALGREREVEWGPRTIDLDILMYDDLILSDDKLQVPHPLMHERLFVLKPLSEIAPNVMHPALERSIISLYEERKADVGDKYDDDLPGFKDIKKGVPDDYERW
jgi:dihydroneopterin aldolase / 2-amino-4-hydroxy-6-hydroxymethyldihydropteridine diphosphokinase